MADRLKLDDVGYIRWSNDHPEGFVLHKKASGFSLHRSQCGHIYEMGVDYRLTTAEKICSNDRSELVSLTQRRTGRRPIRCKSCEP